MISLYLLNYCYDSLSQIPTLLRISDRRKSWGAFISKPLRSRALDAHLYSSSDRGRSTPICTGNLRQNYWQQWLNEKYFALLFVGWSNVLKINIAESSLKFQRFTIAVISVKWQMKKINGTLFDLFELEKSEKPWSPYFLGLEGGNGSWGAIFTPEAKPRG